MADTIEINKNVLEWIIRTAEYNDVQEKYINLLKLWISGKKNPTFKQVESISGKINIPLGYFFLEQPPVEDCFIVEYRTVDSMPHPQPSRNLIDTLDSMVDIQSWMSDYLKDNGHSKLEFIGSVKSVIDSVEIADAIRETIGISTDWITKFHSSRAAFNFFRDELSKLGIVVMMNGIVGNNTHRKLKIDEFRAFTIINDYVPLIFINSCDTDNGKLFSLLHETAHIWLGRNSFYNSTSDYSETSGIETLCNAVVAELLMPKGLFFNNWKSTQGESQEKVELLSKKYNCSRHVVIRRAFNFKFISKKEYTVLIEEANRKFIEWKENNQNIRSGGDYYNNLSSRIDHRFLIALANSAKEGRTQYNEVFRLTNTNRDSFNRFISKIGGVS